MPEVVLRDAVRADVPAIARLLSDDPLGQTREGADPAPYLAAFDRMAAQDANRIVVIEVDGRIAGCAQYTVIHGLSRGGMSRAQIEGVRIGSDQRGLGLGGTLIRALIERARVDGCGMVQLTTDLARKDAHRFYRDLGFEASHTGMKLSL